MAGYEYRAINPCDQIITDAQTGAIIGIRSDQEQNMLNGVSDTISGIGGSLTSISTRQITIPANSQAVSYGGITITAPGSITCGGEFVAVPY